MDTENLIRLIQAVSDSALTGFRYEEGGVRVHLTKKKEQVTGNAVEFLMPEEPSKRSDKEIGQMKTDLAKDGQGQLVDIPARWCLLCRSVGGGSAVRAGRRPCKKRTDTRHCRGDEADE